MNIRKPTRVGRRDFLKATMMAGALHAATPAPAREKKPTLIADENAKPGALDWQLTRVRLDKQNGVRASAIEGYCSRQSVLAGEALDIFVSTNPAVKFTLEIFRTGYYGGRGARLSSPPGHMLPWSHWSRPQGPDARVQRITHNLLQRALA